MYCVTFEVDHNDGDYHDSEFFFEGLEEAHDFLQRARDFKEFVKYKRQKLGSKRADDVNDYMEEFVKTH